MCAVTGSMCHEPSTLVSKASKRPDSALTHLRGTVCIVLVLICALALSITLNMLAQSRAVLGWPASAVSHMVCHRRQTV